MDKGTYIEISHQRYAEFLQNDWLPAIESTIRPSTLRSYTLHVRQYIVPRIGETRLQRLDGATLNRLYSELLSEGRANGPGGLSPATVRRVHATVHRSLRDAVRWGRLIRNPADQADPPKSQASSAPEMTTWTVEELRTFLDHVRSDRLHAMWEVAANTGMRRGEVLGLKWGDVDFSAKRLAVRRTLIALGGEIHESVPKTRRGVRQVAIDGATVVALGEWRRVQLQERLALGAGWRDTEFLFTREDGTPLHPESFSKQFNRHVRLAGLRRIRPHDLRHTHATIALKAGIHPKTMSERLGHATVAITMDTYMHAIPALQEEAAELIADLVSGD